jgi:hypothetical protein
MIILTVSLDPMPDPIFRAESDNIFEAGSDIICGSGAAQANNF